MQHADGRRTTYNHWENGKVAQKNQRWACVPLGRPKHSPCTPNCTYSPASAALTYPGRFDAGNPEHNQTLMNACRIQERAQAIWPAGAGPLVLYPSHVPHHTLSCPDVSHRDVAALWHRLDLTQIICDPGHLRLTWQASHRHLSTVAGCCQCRSRGGWAFGRRGATWGHSWGGSSL